MRSARLELALDSGIWPLSAEGKIAVFRPVAGDDLSALPRERVVVLTGFRPDIEHFAARGYAVTPEPGYAGALICLPRGRDHARALIAEAIALVPQGALLIDGAKTDGVESLIKELRPLGTLSEILSKAHGKIFAFAARPDALPAGWSLKQRPVGDGFVTCPGVFSADGPDPGSELLLSVLPEKLGPKVADLGAGWGYLSRAVLQREGVKRLDLVEAEALALDCARANLSDERLRFHHADALSFRPESLVETVVMNPPFHTGRSADPALGIGFIRAARKIMAPDGVLWMVANRHLPYDEALTEAFQSYETVTQTSAFRVIRAIKPRRVPAKGR
ncbi:class I SAM-dependent methyltransferase [Pseudogemmobacter faecipullorum]|uniref:Class I SAM-dependent methyltransferase n=1 Tax=Pseudogemmobacter faecipullorum TaxID=2755041 RepID=A0ABS8CLA0_9RHOB|nr:class I SAM-dependent methyltransferase [Pseudogemmobacter faecipullorum]MCB5409655.1 class I SAM-dependent methyltransferase [Pseudogemmobacter faecipullorum]